MSKAFQRADAEQALQAFFPASFQISVPCVSLSRRTPQMKVMEAIPMG